MKVTSAYANKILRKLEQDKMYLIDKEKEGKMYVAAEGEDAVIPDYSYEETKAALESIDDKVAKLKHAINVSNSTNTIDINGKHYTIDEILVRMSQLNHRLCTLAGMRKAQEKKRLARGYAFVRGYGSNNGGVEYEYANFNIKKAKQDYDDTASLISAMQLALDEYNNTVQFDVDIEL